MQTLMELNIHNIGSCHEEEKRVQMDADTNEMFVVFKNKIIDGKIVVLCRNPLRSKMNIRTSF